MSRKTLHDFDEAYRYGTTLTLEELKKFDKLIDKVTKEFGQDNVITLRLLEVRGWFL